MVDKLISGFGEGKEIEVNTSSAILQQFIKDNWNLLDPDTTEIDWGGSPDRTVKPITIRTYTILSNILNADIGSNFFAFEVPVAIDVFVRDIKAMAERREPTKIVAIETYLRDFISTNRLALRDKGINHMHIGTVNFVDEPADDEQDEVWYHLVVEVRMYFHMNRVPV
jgi:hypothetical protein